MFFDLLRETSCFCYIDYFFLYQIKMVYFNIRMSEPRWPQNEVTEITDEYTDY